jgi:hypothetical protein
MFKMQESYGKGMESLASERLYATNMTINDYGESSPS